jgi:DNA-binding MarR family transcriptional regulator
VLEPQALKDHAAVNDARRKPFDRWSAAVRTLIDEVMATSERIRAAQGHSRRGSTFATLRLLRVVAASNRYLAIAEAGRVLRLSRQAAHETVVRAAAAGFVELLPNRDDRRILQIELTPLGRSVLAKHEAKLSAWLGDLLIGLPGRDLATVIDVLRGFRERIVRAEQRVAAKRRRQPPVSR